MLDIFAKKYYITASYMKLFEISRLVFFTAVGDKGFSRLLSLAFLCNNQPNLCITWPLPTDTANLFSGVLMYIYLQRKISYVDFTS